MRNIFRITGLFCTHVGLVQFVEQHCEKLQRSKMNEEVVLTQCFTKFVFSFDWQPERETIFRSLPKISF